MLITLLRHAEAEDWSSAPNDYERRLTDKGYAQSARAARFCNDHGLLPDLIITSPLRRAVATAGNFAETAELTEPVVEEFLASGMNPEAAIEGLSAYTKFKHIMIVGHEPDFSLLIAHLLGAEWAAVEVKKASLITLSCRSLGKGGGTLMQIIPSKLMKTAQEERLSRQK